MVSVGLRRLLCVASLGPLALGCKPEVKWLDEVETPRLETIASGAAKFEWNGEISPLPPTWEEAGRGALQPVPVRDDSGIPSRFFRLLDVVDQAGLTDVSELTWYGPGGEAPRKFGSSPDTGFWAPNRSPELWVVDAQGKMAARVPLRARIHPALVVHPEVLDFLDEEKAGERSRSSFTDFVRDSYLSEQAQYLPRSSWLRWARWAQMKGDAESATALLEHYESEVKKSCDERCNENEYEEAIAPTHCDLLEHARADIALHIESTVSLELEEDWLPWDDALARLRTATAIHQEVSPNSERLLRLAAIGSYLDWREQFEPLWAKGLDKLEPKDRALALIALMPENAPALRGPNAACCYDLSRELVKLPIDVLPAMAWFFSVGASLPQRGGGLSMANAGDRGGPIRHPLGKMSAPDTLSVGTSIMWRICALADASWLPERAPRICGNESPSCGVQVILERLELRPDQVLPPLPTREPDGTLISGSYGPQWLPREGRTLQARVSCEKHAHREESRERVLRPECLLRGLREPAFRFGRTAGHLARLAARSRRMTEDYYDADHEGVDLRDWWEFVVEVAIVYVENPDSQEMTTRWLDLGVEVLSGVRVAESLGALDTCESTLDALEKPIGWLDLSRLETAGAADLPAWHVAHTEAFDQLVLDVRCEAHIKITGDDEGVSRGEVRRRAIHGSQLNRLRYFQDSMPSGSAIINAVLSLPHSATFRPLSTESLVPWVQRVEGAYEQSLGHAAPTFPTKTAERDTLCLRPRPT